MKELDNWKVVQVNLNYNASNTQTANIFVEFEPDYVILKNVSGYNNSVNGDWAYNITSPLIKDPVLFSIIDIVRDEAGTDSLPFYLAPEIPFKLDRAVNGLYSFNLTNGLGQIVTNLAGINLTLTLTLVFVKSKK
jgi:hypothetical protein